MLTKKIQRVAGRLKDQLSQRGAIVEGFPLQQYIDYLSAYPRILDYNIVLPEVKTYCDRIIEAGSTSALDLYHKLLLCELITRAIERLTIENFPRSVKNKCIQNFSRILEDIDGEVSKVKYLYPNDKFLKNMAICNLRLIPVGARKINLSVLPVKNFMFNKGLRQFIDLACFVAMELRGIRPLYIGHLDTNDPDLVLELNPKGLKKAYLRIVDMLKANPEVKGYFGTSWMLDPQLEAINMRHQYARRLVTDNGGKLYYKGPSKSALKNSLVKSQTRRKLYEEGKYIPTDYVIVWSRQKMIKWAEKIMST